MTWRGGRRQRAVALVPLRDPGEGKSRLASQLDTEQRRQLVIAMATDVVACLRASAVDEIVLVAAGPGAAQAARRLGVAHVRDVPGTCDLNDSLATATSGSTADVLVVMADLPALRPSDVDRVLASTEDVVVVPSRDGGTGGLLQRADAPPTFTFGPGSAHRHLAAGRRSGRRTRLLRVPGFAHDVDTWEDLTALDRLPHVGVATAELLERLRRPVGGQITSRTWSPDGGPKTTSGASLMSFPPAETCRRRSGRATRGRP